MQKNNITPRQRAGDAQPRARSAPAWGLPALYSYKEFRSRLTQMGAVALQGHDRLGITAVVMRFRERCNAGYGVGMKIAQIAPLEEAVPPKFYGGTERVVAYLTDALIELGHDVTLFASGDSHTRAKLVATWPQALRLSADAEVVELAARTHLDVIGRDAGRFDVIHSHIDYAGFPVLRRARVPSLTTMHGRLDLPELGPIFSGYGDMQVISISDAQRLPLPEAAFAATVLHGLPQDLLKQGEGCGGYLAFLGRMSPEKGPVDAIRIATGVDLPLQMAAKIGDADRDYFLTMVQPLLRGRTEFIGEIREDQKQRFLGEAAALLFPIAWPEPFGLVMIEAMACGTPVIAYDNGSVREILEDGVTGFIVTNEREAQEAVRRIGSLDRNRIRAEFERRFTARQMALNYIEVYRAICDTQTGVQSVPQARRRRRVTPELLQCPQQPAFA